MATVYEAVHNRLNAKVAIKVLDPILARKEDIKIRFENEAKIMATLKHPYITQVIDFDDTNDTLSIIMELLEGESLSDYIKKNGALEKKETFNIFYQMLDAFAFAHQNNIVHRDVKPSNIFISSNEKVKILDFGIAKILEGNANLTNTGTQMGTPTYMSPEQVKDSKDIDLRSDIYSLGVVLFYMLNGEPPYDTSTVSKLDIFNKIVGEQLPQLKKYPEIDKIIQKATDKDREDRYQTCEEFMYELQNIEQQNKNNFKQKQEQNFKEQAQAKLQKLEASAKQIVAPTNEKKNKATPILIALIAVLCIAFLFAWHPWKNNKNNDNINAFIKIDESFRVASDNFQSRNEQIYTEFVKSEMENPIKIKPFKDKADKIVEKSDELFETIQELKLLLIQTADKEISNENPESNIKNKDNINVGRKVMIRDGKGTELRELLNEYRDLLISLADENEGMINNLNSILNTDDIDGFDGKKVSWETANFQQLPLIAVVALMSKMQSDIRNAEGNALNYLLSKISLGEFIFNKIEAIVYSPSNYVLLNQPYKAEIFIIASDTTKEPQIFLTGSETPLKVENGKGIFTGSTGSIGIKSYGGVIKLNNPWTGETMEFPFQSEYQVGAPSVAISPIKMNVFYIGVDNPVSITASGVPASSVMASISGAGTIRKAGNGKYVVTVKSTNDVTVNVSAKVGESVRNLGSMSFRCKRVPDPIAQVGGKTGGRISKSALATASVSAKLENFPFDLSFPIVSFSVTTVQNGFTVSEKASGTRLSAAQKKIISSAKSGQRLYFEDIKAKAPDGSTRSLGTIKFIIQ